MSDPVRPRLRGAMRRRRRDGRRGHVRQDDPGKTALDFEVTYAGEQSTNEEGLRPPRAFGDPILDGVRSQSYANGGVYVTLLGSDEADRVASAQGPNHDRLARLKNKSDPAPSSGRTTTWSPPPECESPAH